MIFLLNGQNLPWFGKAGEVKNDICQYAKIMKMK
jgi:hypothetical protein